MIKSYTLILSYGIDDVTSELVLPNKLGFDSFQLYLDQEEDISP